MEAVRCPACGTLTRGEVPAAVRAPVPYGPGVRAAAVSLTQYPLLPEERTSAAVADRFGAGVSDGTVATWVAQASEALAPPVARIAALVATGSHQHADETGIRVQGKLHWLHVNSPRWLTHLAWHRQRGSAATEAIGLWPRFRGWATHDRWARYDAYALCQQRWCVAHLVRDLTFLAEEHHQRWAAHLRELLLAMHQAVEEGRAHGAAQVPLHEQGEWIAAYHELLVTGYAAQPPPTPAHAGPAGPTHAAARQESPRRADAAGRARAGLPGGSARALHQHPG